MGIPTQLYSIYRIIHDWSEWVVWSFNATSVIHSQTINLLTAGLVY